MHLHFCVSSHSPKKWCVCVCVSHVLLIHRAMRDLKVKVWLWSCRPCSGCCPTKVVQFILCIQNSVSNMHVLLPSPPSWHSRFLFLWQRPNVHARKIFGNQNCNRPCAQLEPREWTDGRCKQWRISGENSISDTKFCQNCIMSATSI